MVVSNPACSGEAHTKREQQQIRQFRNGGDDEPDAAAACGCVGAGGSNRGDDLVASLGRDVADAQAEKTARAAFDQA